jgi:K+-transporting ATPase ATPase C chain
MVRHIRANLGLLILTVLVCSGLYPLALWGIGQALFRNQAQGSLIDKSGKLVTEANDAVGSQLIAQPFTGDEYFQPRPSAAAYNAAASGASNWAANNYQLRFRVAKAFGPIVKYGSKSPKNGQNVGPDIELWFQTHPLKDGKGIVAQWAQTYPSAALMWVKDDKANAAYVEAWQKTHPDAIARWIKDNPNTPDPKPEDLAVTFFVSYSAEHPATFPSLQHKTSDGKTEKVMEPVNEGTDIQSYFFDMWRQKHPDVDLEQVPADLVMASGSGLDPHITLKGARYQLDRVANAWGKKTGIAPATVKAELEALLREKAFAPLGGIAGVPLVNVLEINLALPDRMRNRGEGSAMRDQ